VDFLSKSADLGPTATNLMHLGMALLESGQKERARQVFRKAKSFKMKGAGLEEKILEQIRSTTKLIDRLHARRRRAANKSWPVSLHDMRREISSCVIGASCIGCKPKVLTIFEASRTSTANGRPRRSRCRVMAPPLSSSNPDQSKTSDNVNDTASVSRS